MKRPVEVERGNDYFSCLFGDILHTILSYLVPGDELALFRESLNLSHTSRLQRQLFNEIYTEERMIQLFRSNGAMREDTTPPPIHIWEREEQFYYRLVSIANLTESYAVSLSKAFGEKTRKELFSWIETMGRASWVTVTPRVHTTEYKELRTELRYVQSNFSMLREELKMAFSLSILSLYPYRHHKTIVVETPNEKSKFCDLYTYVEPLEDVRSIYHITLDKGIMIDVRRLERLRGEGSYAQGPRRIYTLTHYPTKALDAPLFIVRRMEASRRFKDALMACYKALRELKDPSSAANRKLGKKQAQIEEKRRAKFKKSHSG
jgi:hypothetical protein